MFDLEKAIAKWRKELTRSGLASPEVFEELESHLRDEVESQLCAGLDPARAFENAVMKMGQAGSIKREFSKLGGDSGIGLRKLLALFCSLAAPLMLALVAWSIWDDEADRSGRIIGLLVVSMISCYVAALPFIYRYFPDPSKPRVRIFLKISNVLFCGWTILELLGGLGIVHAHFRNYFSMVGWALYTAYACTVLAYACRGSTLPGIAQAISGPSTDRFTELAQSALEMARQEAFRLNHGFIGTEHLLLGILGSQSGLLMDILRRHSVAHETIRAMIESQIPKGPPFSDTRKIQFTPRAKRALAFAEAQAYSLRHTHIHAEHIFLGLLLEDEGVAGIVLRNLKFNFKTVRAQISNGFGPDDENGAQPVTAG
jgi:hypothetical protein